LGTGWDIALSPWVRRLSGWAWLVIGLADNFWLVLIPFFFTGIGSGIAYVPVMGLASNWFGSSLRGLASGLLISGIGLGIMITGLLIPAVNSWMGNSQGWRFNWMIMGGLVLLIGVLSAIFIRNRPEDMGLQILEKTTNCPFLREPFLMISVADIPVF